MTAALAASKELIGARTATVLPAAVDAAASQIISPQANSALTAGASIAVTVQPRDSFGNAALPGALSNLYSDSSDT